jgi:adenylosuccinate synthase
MKVSIVLGLGFGDEGKGSFVNYLCSKAKNPLVVRFSGGHQVGHTVVVDDKRHVFSNFGSGTLIGVPTYWSEFCTLSPTGILKEGNALREMGITPKLFINANAMVTTPFDILQNHRLEEKNNHGSVGVGFGTTIQRNEDHFHLYARDLLYPKIRDEKLWLIINTYYKLNFNPKEEHQHATTKRLYNDFLLACDDLVSRYQIVNNFVGLLDHEFIFEGSQGIMLDTDYGFFPHVTRSNTTSKNVFELMRKYNLPGEDIQTFYITRAYQTRHGNGYMTNIGMDTSYIKENPKETNVEGFQGEFRKTVLDLDLLKYAFECDKYHNPVSRKGIVITCLDQVPENIPVTIGGNLCTVKFNEIGKYCGISFKYPCYSDTGYKFTIENC